MVAFPFYSIFGRILGILKRTIICWCFRNGNERAPMRSWFAIISSRTKPIFLLVTLILLGVVALKRTRPSARIGTDDAEVEWSGTPTTQSTCPLDKVHGVPSASQQHHEGGNPGFPSGAGYAPARRRL